MARKEKMITLYHYTSRLHWSAIAGSGVITRTESNIDPSRPHPGSVVWLTDSFTARQDWQNQCLVDKSEVRITLRIPEAWVIRWCYYAARKKVPGYWYRILAEKGGDPASWLVCEHDIPVQFWISASDTRTGALLYGSSPGDVPLPD